MASIDEEIKSRFENDRHRMTANVMFTAGWIGQLMTSFLKPFGLSNQQFNILRILRGAGDWVAMNTVKDRMVEKSPNATRLADKLLGKNLIVRRRSESDRRVVYIKITQTGLRLLKDIDEQDDGVLRNVMNRITDEEARQVAAVLDKMRG